MKIKAKFIGFFTLGLILFLLYISLIVALSFEAVLPILGIADSTLAFVIVSFAAFVSGGGLFSVWFVGPITAMMELISDISAGDFNPQEAQKIYKKNRKLKKRYWLYKELISDIDSLAEQLKQAEIERGKLEQAKQDWVRGISHDIKTPLSYVVGYSSLLLSQDHSWTQEEQQNFLSLIHQKGKYIENLINNMNLSFSLEDNTRLLPLQISTFDLITFMEKLVFNMLNQQPNADYSISLQALDAHLNIEADEQLLYRAITNLINNAIQHNPVGTEIKVEIKRDEQCGVNILVCDNGVGMSQESVENLFEKYNDTHNAAMGKKDYVSGLGLSIVKSVIQAHRGDIFVDSKENYGTIFTLHLPF
jgi:signal transduction histidine kinase